MHDCITEIKDFIVRQFLPGEDPDNLKSTDPLITGGILDSISILKLVDHLERTYSIRFEAFEVDADHLDTLHDITALVERKRSSDP